MLTLRSRRLVMQLRPDLGGCVAGLHYNGVPVLRSADATALSDVRQSACYALVPFSNRIDRGCFLWRGRTHRVQPNFLPEPHAIHGVGWQRPWTVVSVADAQAVLRYQHQADAAWPFAFECQQTHQLDDDGWMASLHVTNLDTRPAPVGLGWHPYFVKRKAGHVRLKASGRWAMGPDHLPTVCEPSEGLDLGVEALQIDHCFEGWPGQALLRDGELNVQLSASASRLVVFTDDSKDFVALEPVSHANNALGRKASERDRQAWGIHVLGPGETFDLHMLVRVDAVPSARG